MHPALHLTNLSTTKRAGKPAFFSSLESLRGIAALSVVVFHASWTNPITLSHFFRNGALQVDFFFVLSGFIICHSYGSRLTTATDIRRFVILRLGRLYPLHIIFLAVFVFFKFASSVIASHSGLVNSAFMFLKTSGYALVNNLFLLQGMNTLSSLTFNYPSWSISTEFFAYLLFAALRRTVGKRRWYVLAACVVITFGEGIILHFGPITIADAMYDWGFTRCCLGFFLGTLVWHLYDQLPRVIAGSRNLSTAMFPSAIALEIFFLATANPAGRETYIFPVLASLVVFSAVRYDSPICNRLLGSGIPLWLGRISYSVYMTHAAVGWVFSQMLLYALKMPKITIYGDPMIYTPDLLGVFLLVLYVLVVLAVSHVTYLFIESPFRLRAHQFVNGRTFQKRDIKSI